ncbi:hypothetical protein GCM10027160_16120 [Streptomyces calidiresistens]
MTTIRFVDDPPGDRGAPGLPIPTTRPAEVPEWRAAPPSAGDTLAAGVTSGTGVPDTVAPPLPAHHPLPAARPATRAVLLLLVAAVVAACALLVVGPPAPRGLSGEPVHPTAPPGTPDPSPDSSAVLPTEPHRAGSPG